MKFWTDRNGGCLRCCIASFVGCTPDDVPYDDDEWFDVDQLNVWLEERGRRLRPVRAQGTWAESIPSGYWIALEARSQDVSHAVICFGPELAHDPAGHGVGVGRRISIQNLAAAHDLRFPLGYVMESV